MENFPQTIIKELQLRGVAPKPRWHFLVMRMLFWVLIAASIIVGGIAISVGWYVFFDNEGFHVSLGNLFQVIPFIWLFVLAVFVTGAYFGFRHTRKGYRYSTAGIVGCIIGASLLLSLLLDHFDLGQGVHKYLLGHTGFYDGLIYSSEDQPD